MSVALKLSRVLKASPVNLIYALLKCGLLVMVLPLAPTADLLVLIWNLLLKADADDLLGRDLETSKRWVSRLVKKPISENQFSSLVSFPFNVGCGALKRSTLRMKLNRGEYLGAADEFPKWRRAGGRILAGLVRRRVAERSLFLA